MNIKTLRNILCYSSIIFTFIGSMLLNIFLSCYFGILIYDTYDFTNNFINSSFCKFIFFITMFLILTIVEYIIIFCIGSTIGLSIYAFIILYKAVCKKDDYVVYDDILV